MLPQRIGRVHKFRILHPNLIGPRQAAASVDQMIVTFALFSRIILSTGNSS